MRFTKIPLIATLMAVALSLLIVLPTLAQVSGDRTDGRLSVGSWLDVRVADNIDDLDNTPGNDLPGTGGTAQIEDEANAWATAEGGTAFAARDTYFNGSLYVSNKEKAYNTILITARVDGDGTVDAKTSNIASVLSGPDRKFNGDGTSGLGVPGTTGDDAVNIDNIDCLGDGVAVATVRNSRSNTSVTVYLPETNETDPTSGTDAVNIYQGILAVWDQEEDVEKHDGPCGVAHVDPMAHDADASDTDTDPADGWTVNSAAVIPARDGDTLTITVKGVAGSIRVVVDGDAPEIEEATPTASDPQKSKTVQLGFVISDDGAGIRYDGESGNSVDQDPAPQNGDGDQNLSEPLTCGPDPDASDTAATDCGGRGGRAVGSTTAGDGTTKDIEVRFTGDVDDAYNPAKRDENGDLVAHTGTSVDGDDGVITIDGALYDTVDDSKPGKAAPDADDVGLLKDMSAVWGTDTDDSDKAVGGDWTENTRGVEYALDMTLTGNGFGTYHWQVTAKDRVGNSVTTDGDEDEKGKQPYSFKVDDADPEVTLARTGIGYEPGEGEFKDRSWIALHFMNEDQGGDDRIRSSTVEADEFTVEGNTVINAISPTDKPVCKDDDPETTRVDESAKNIQWYAERNASLDCEGYDPRAHVYLELAEALDSDDEPTIQLLGGILQDIAGNNNATQSLEDEVEDWIAPGITITITSSSGTASRAATDDDGSFTVNVTSDEDLVTFPRLYFATITGKAKVTGADDDGANGVGEAASGLTIMATGGEVNLSEDTPNNWEKKVNADSDSIPGTGDRIVAVVITATDLNRNSGNSAGWTDGDDDGVPDATEKLDFKKLDAGGFLLEIDNNLMKADIEVLPSTDPGTVKNMTESANPYIQITFSEPNEYGIAVTDDKDTTGDDDPDPTDDETGTSKSIVIKDSKPAKTDSHPGVAITAFTLNGEDRLSEIVAVNAYTYVLAVTGLEIGDYTIYYEAMDDVGNEVDEDDREFDFEVLERQPYEIDLQPGWNLISVPGDPFNPAVGNVIGSGLKADTVLGYQSGEWVTAVRNEDGRWQGTLTDIQGGYGYWVRTTVVETIETVIPPTLPTSNLPTVPIISGWNLVGVVDAQQRAVDIEDRVGEDADQYLTSLGNNWRVAYSFETQLNRWEKLIPNGGTADDPHMMLNGKGYWLWNSAPGTLVP